MDREFDAPEGEPVYPSGGASRLRDRLRVDVLVAVAVGGAAGGVTRAAIGQALLTHQGEVPWAILIINVSGSFIIGALLALPPLIEPGRTRLRALTTTGFCGGFTTWSTFMVGTDQLLARGHPGAALGYLFGSVIAGLLAAVVGAAHAERVIVRRGTAP